ncbi:ISL3 family transposase (plasmid) [Streptomyces sp. NBC_00853]|uniref:ISL3 family transposase n=1 Tax=Streptomyces sp. NBC_00853 TaxID=2903681 RepID=UPI003872D405|nr:ISL3 family transposase [Streptomyces sp. NBC_00853]
MTIWVNRIFDRHRTASGCFVLHAPSAGSDVCCARVFLPDLKDVLIQGVDDLADAVVVTVRTVGKEAGCPSCGALSARVHSRYRRVLDGLAAGGRPVSISLVVRRFFCRETACSQRIFAEQVGGLTTRYARRTTALREFLTGVAIALAGRAGARLAAAAGVATGRSSLLRILRSLPDPEVGKIRLLGVDDFAKRRGNSYATILIDLESRRPVDILDGRTSAHLAQWLKAHPGIEVICRDRAGAYAEGAREGAPGATQCADRWHLWSNLGDALEKTVRAHRARLGEATGGDEVPRLQEDEEPPPERPKTLDSCGNERSFVDRTRTRYTRIQQLRARGASLNSISRDLGLAFRTVQRFANAASADELLAPVLHRGGKLDRFKPYLIDRWNEGCTNAVQLHQELATQGWTGSIRTVQGYLRPLRGHSTAAVPPSLPPSSRRLTGWMMSHPDGLDSNARIQLKEFLARCPELDMAAGFVRGFAAMMTNREGHLLDEWITAVTAADSVPHLASFASGLRRDLAAVTAGLTLPHSSGTVEGTVNKIKFLKRQMFGRANLDLLRIRVLHHR